jgi:Domain of unknown function (DUF4440)
MGDPEELCLRSLLHTNFAAVAALPMFSALARAQSGQGLPPSDDLFRTVAGLDTALFDAYNHCELDRLGSMVDENLEFYHDQTGLSVGREVFVQAIRNNICGKVHRELVQGSLEVYPLKGYGAVEVGVHRFTHPGNAAERGEAKFVTVWREKDGVWMVTRAISFDHHPMDH